MNLNKTEQNSFNNMKILLSNDDGITAPGIKLLEKAVLKLSSNITVIAPDSNKSGASHGLTLATPFRVNEMSKNHYSVSGTPVDSVAFGLRYLFNDRREYPDLVVSGINSDANLSEDIIYSGTIAVAREACLFGIPSIAFSQQRFPDRSIEWTVAEHYTEIILRKILKNYRFIPKVFLSINFPAVNLENVKGIKVAPQGARIIEDRIVKSIDPRGDPYYWIGDMQYRRIQDVNSDLEVADKGYITITPITIDATAYSQIPKLEEDFNEEY